MSEEQRVKVLLDTDIGTDIDDAVCLAYLLQQPRCDLLGITTVTGQAIERAKLASAICRWAGRGVPIYPGADDPILVAQRQTTAQQAECLPRWEHQERFPQGEAVEFLRATIRKHPGEVVLLCVAPLTNIGLLFRVDPEIPRLLRGLVLMCGRFTGSVGGNAGPTEWNASGDPHATAIVYGSAVSSHRSLGLDVTTRVSMDAATFRQAFHGARLFQPVLDFAEVWFRDWNGTTFHDPLAAVSIFDPSICRFARGEVNVDLSEGETLGRTRWAPDAPGGSHEIGIDVDPVRFFEHFISVCR
ncbi:MAG: nucleoside hydrolase [Bacteroidetes bacterium]|nr:nucleoside hydrolase [Bacteroidota bacterium]